MDCCRGIIVAVTAGNGLLADKQRLLSANYDTNHYNTFENNSQLTRKVILKCLL